MNWNVHWKHIGHRSGKIILPATQNQILRSTAKNIYEHIFIWALTDRNNVNLALREKLEFSASLNYRNLPFERCRIKNQLYIRWNVSARFWALKPINQNWLHNWLDDNTLLFHPTKTTTICRCNSIVFCCVKYEILKSCIFFFTDSAEARRPDI